MGRWFIVRHGETEWNAQGRIQGHTDISLSERGIQQSRLVGQRLAGVTLDVAYSSDLARSAETAQQILDQRAVPLHTTSRLREFNKGVFEGLTPEETGQQFPDLFEASQVNDLDFAPPGGESIRETSERMNAIMTELRIRHPDENVLIVGHGGALRAGFVALMELPLEANWRFTMTNCGLSVLDIYPNNAVLRLYNDSSHLDGLGPKL